VDFTPSTGTRLPALAALAAEQRVPYAGHDGKTGETLLKSVLAPMFALRHLRVRSWSGMNLLGGGDGASLAEPAANAAKTASKQRVLRETLGYEPEGQTRIDYVPDIGDFKTAWDLITFGGFLGTPMRLEFTWHGCDSALAAPLVLDLARLAAAAHADGWVGPIHPLAFFFKDPLGEVEHSLPAQWLLLRSFVEGLGTAGASA
jgi:myo-inositol-1-phosphate synthase